MNKTFKELKVNDPIYMLSMTMQPKKAYVVSITQTTNSLSFGLKDKYGNKLPYNRSIHIKFLNNTTALSTATNKEDAHKLKIKKISNFNQKYRRNEVPF